MGQARLAISGHAFSALRPQELLQRLRQYGLRYLDLWPHNAADLSPLEYRDLAADHGIQVMCVNVPAAHGIFLPGAREAIAAGIDTARALGAPLVQFYSGVPPWPRFLDTVKAFARDVADLAARAAEAGVTLCLENNVDQRQVDVHDLNPSRRAEMVLAVLEAVDSSAFRLTFDATNFYCVGDEPVPYAYELVRGYIANVHLKDAVRYTEHRHGRTHAAHKRLVDVKGGPHLVPPVGQGAVNYERLFERLAADAYQGWFTLDPFAHPEPVAELDAWCRQSLAYLAGKLDWQGQ